MRASRSAGGRVPVTHVTVVALRSAARRCSATYSAVSMNRQNTIGSNPSASSPCTTEATLASFASALPSRAAACLAMASSRRRCGLSAAFSASSAPGVASSDSTDSSSARSITAERPSASASSQVVAPAFFARVRSVAAAARGDEANARSSASADHQRTRCRTAPSPVSRTVSRA